jgi:hypothetical protein
MICEKVSWIIWQTLVVKYVMYLNGHLEDVQTYYADQKPQCGPLQSLVIMFVRSKEKFKDTKGKTFSQIIN